MKTLKITWLLTKALIITAAFEAACLVSRECREIKAACKANCEEIDPIAKIEAQLDEIWK